MKTFGQLFVGGLAGLLILKLLAAIILPLFGLMLGLLATAFKVAIFVCVAYCIYRMFKGKGRNRDDD